MKLRTIVISLAAAVAVAAAMAAMADSRGKPAEDKEDGLKGSIAVGKEADAKLLSMARISLADAVAAAVAKVPGKCWKAELEPEDGSLIYTIQVVTKGGEWKEIAIDAGNGKVLLVEKGDREDFAGANEKAKEGRNGEEENDEGKGSAEDGD